MGIRVTRPRRTWATPGTRRRPHARARLTITLAESVGAGARAAPTGAGRHGDVARSRRPTSLADAVPRATSAVTPDRCRLAPRGAPARSNASCPVRPPPLPARVGAITVASDSSVPRSCVSWPPLAPRSPAPPLSRPLAASPLPPLASAPRSARPPPGRRIPPGPPLSAPSATPPLRHPPLVESGAHSNSCLRRRRVRSLRPRRGSLPGPSPRLAPRFPGRSPLSRAR